MGLSVILPDGKALALEDGATAMDAAKAISPRLADVVVVARLDGVVSDIRTPLKDGVKIELMKADSPEGRDAINHSAEHLMATAVLNLFPGAKVTMGPRTHEAEFYYDFDVAGRTFGPDELGKIEAEMRKLIDQKTPFEMKTVSKKDAFAIFDSVGQNNEYKSEILSWIPEDSVTLYQNGNFVDLCRGPHLPHAGFIKGLKLTTASSAYWRADSAKQSLQRVRGIAFPKKEELDKHLHHLEEAKKRDHRRLGKELELFLVSERYDDHSYNDTEELDLYVGIEADAPADRVLLEFVLGLATDMFPGRTLRQTVKMAHAPADSKDALPAADVRLRGSMTPDARKAFEAALRAREGVQLTLTIELNYTEEIGPGLVMWLPKGGRLRTTIEDQWRKMHFEGGYEVVYSPHIAKADLWKVSGHWNFYREGMFSPMSVDGHEFPMRLAELGTVYRYELAGVMHGLMRVRGFTQDDAHLFCRWDQVDQEIDRVLRFILKMLRTFGFTDFEVNLSTRPDKYVGSLEDWAKSESALESALKRAGLKYQVDVGGGAFYGPKIDIKLVDALERKWQCSTLQYDFNNPERFSLEFVNAKGEKEQPVMLHRALLGSIERFIGILVEHYAGALPGWLSPEQVRVVTVSDKHNDHGDVILAALKEKGIRASFEPTSEKLGAKIRNAQMEKIPMMLVIGDKEVEGKGATVRMRDGTDQGFMSQEAMLSFVLEKCAIPVIADA
jgi:threonyl-tRNA synthetase